MTKTTELTGPQTDEDGDHEKIDKLRGTDVILHVKTDKKPARDHIRDTRTKQAQNASVIEGKTQHGSGNDDGDHTESLAENQTEVTVLGRS